MSKKGRIIILVLVLVIAVGLIINNQRNKSQNDLAADVASDSFKIGLATGTVSQGEDEYRGALSM